MLKLFITFFKIGLFTLGGGYAMIPLIERDVVERNRWVSKEEFLDLLAVAQAAPGVFAVNISIFIGYKLRGVWGSIVAAIGNVLPYTRNQGCKAHTYYNIKYSFHNLRFYLLPV